MAASFECRTVPFTVRVSRDACRACVFLDGELDVAGVERVEHQVDTLILTPPVPSEIWIELTGLTFVDVVGARALARAYERLDKAARVCIRGGHPNVLRVLSLIGVTLPGEESPRARRKPVESRVDGSNGPSRG
jgi:anti-anti-sigma factor